MMNVNYGLGTNCRIKSAIDLLSHIPLMLFDFFSTTVKKMTVKFLLYIVPHVIIDEKKSTRKKNY